MAARVTDEFTLVPDPDPRAVTLTARRPVGDGGSPAEPLIDVDHLSPLAFVELVATTETEAEGAMSDTAAAWRALAVTVLEGVVMVGLRASADADGRDRWRLAEIDRFLRTDIEAHAASLPPLARAEPDPKSDSVVSAMTAATDFATALIDELPRAAGSATRAACEPANHRLGEEAVVLHGFGDGPPISATVEPSPPIPAIGCHLGRVGSSATATLVVHHPSDPALSIDAAEVWENPEAAAAVFATPDLELLRRCRRAAEIAPVLEPLLADVHPTRLDLQLEDLVDLLGSSGDALAEAGFHITWDRDLVSPLDVQRVLGAAEHVDGESRAAVAGLEGDLELTWTATARGDELTDDELSRLLASPDGVIATRGHLLRPTEAQLRRLRRSDTITPATALAVALGGELWIDGELVPIEVSGPLAILADRLAGLDQRRDLAEPASMTATLRPYQRRGLAWLVEMAELGLGGVLADDMGLGKTIQVLGLHLERLDRGRVAPALVICPASLVGNWEREAARFAPELDVHRYHGAQRTLAEVGPGDLVVTTYGVAARDTAALDRVEWGLVIADEAQAIKNPASSRARAVRKISSGARIALTGTPVENRLIDLWSILDWTTPGLLGPLARFRREIVSPIERDADASVTQSFAQAVKPFILRRRKSDPAIVPELPPKTETDRYVGLTDEQSRLYQSVLDLQMDDITGTSGAQRRGLVFKLITGLKQVCNHPAHYLGQDDGDPDDLGGRSGKLQAATDLLEVIRDSSAHALLFTQYVVMGNLLQRHLEGLGFRTLFLHGSLTLPEREQLVDRFQAGEADVFLLSLTAGGTGLNLTRATHVIHYDRWWNPAVEDQASDRAWRIGQDQPVQVHRLICEGTIEERIAALSASKRRLAGDVVAGGEGWISDLSDDDLHTLVRLAAPGDDETDEFDALEDHVVV